MNESELMAKLDEAVSLVKRLHAETIELKSNVEELHRKVDKLDERLTYREKVLVGWKEIADYIDTTTKSAQAWADESFDPLPVHKREGRVFALATALDAYAERRKTIRKVPRYAPRSTTENPS